VFSLRGKIVSAFILRNSLSCCIYSS